MTAEQVIALSPVIFLALAVAVDSAFQALKRRFKKMKQKKVYWTCGECKHFVPNDEGAYGKCAKRDFLFKRGGRNTEYQDLEFVPGRSHKACVDNFERKQSEG